MNAQPTLSPPGPRPYSYRSADTAGARATSTDLKLTVSNAQRGDYREQAERLRLTPHPEVDSLGVIVQEEASINLIGKNVLLSGCANARRDGVRKRTVDVVIRIRVSRFGRSRRVSQLAIAAVTVEGSRNSPASRFGVNERLRKKSGPWQGIDDSGTEFMSERLKIFEHALDECRRLLVQYPGNGALQSIEKQIGYLIGLESGAHADRTRLHEIILGAQTAREIEALDEGVAGLFYRVASEARQM